jgi:hypothetical protein
MRSQKKGLRAGNDWSEDVVCILQTSNTHGISIVSLLQEKAMRRFDTNVVTTHAYELLLLLLQILDIEWRQHCAASRSDCGQNSHIQR